MSPILLRDRARRRPPSFLFPSTLADLTRCPGASRRRARTPPNTMADRGGDRGGSAAASAAATAATAATATAAAATAAAAAAAGRGRGRDDDKDKWTPCTKLGRLVQQGQDQVPGAHLPVLHPHQGVPDCRALHRPRADGRGDEDHARAKANRRGPAHAGSRLSWSSATPTGTSAWASRRARKSRTPSGAR